MYMQDADLILPMMSSPFLIILIISRTMAIAFPNLLSIDVDLEFKLGAIHSIRISDFDL